MPVAVVVIQAIYFYAMTLQPLCHRGASKEFIAFFLFFCQDINGEYE